MPRSERRDLRESRTTPRPLKLKDHRTRCSNSTSMTVDKAKQSNNSHSLDSSSIAKNVNKNQNLNKDQFLLELSNKDIIT